MPSRMTETNVTFANAATIGPAIGTVPPGTYRVVLDEDEISGLSFLAFRRSATRFYTPAVGGFGTQQVFEVDPSELDAAIGIDRERSGRGGRN